MHASSASHHFSLSVARCAGHDVVDRAMDMLDILAVLDLDSPAGQQTAAAAATMQQPEVSAEGLHSSTLRQEGQGSGQPLVQGSCGTAADCNVAGGPGGAVEEGAAGAAQRTEDAGAMPALQHWQSLRNPFCKSSALPNPSHGDSVGQEVEHLKQVRQGGSLAHEC